jgi:hypothetical protein
MGLIGQSHAPTVLPPGKTRYPLYRRLDGPHSRSANVWNPKQVQPRIYEAPATRSTNVVTVILPRITETGERQPAKDGGLLSLPIYTASHSFHSDLTVTASNLTHLNILKTTNARW